MTSSSEVANRPDRRATAVRWRVLALVAFASASAYLTRYCISAANTTIQQDLSFDDKQMGWIMGGFSLGYMLFQVPGGLFGIRFGTRVAFAATSVLWSLCSIWSGAASLLYWLWASRFGLGAFQAGLTPISAKILKDWIPLANRGLSSAAIAACMSLGGAFTMWYTGRLLESDYYWRDIFVAYSAVGIVWAVVFYWYFRTYPADHRGVNDLELKQIKRSLAGESAGQGEHESARGVSASQDWTDLWLPMLSPSMIALCVQSFCRAAGYAFFVTWFFAFLEYKYGTPKDQAGLLTSLPLLAVVCGTTGGGFLIDWLYRTTGSKRISRSGTGLVALGICAVLTMVSAWTSTAAQLSIVMALGALFSGLASPAAWATTIDIGGRHTAIVMGVMNMAGCLAGAILPITLGEWFDAIKTSGGSWDPVIYVHAAFYAIAAVCWFWINSSRSLFAGRSR